MNLKALYYINKSNKIVPDYDMDFVDCVYRRLVHKTIPFNERTNIFHGYYIDCNIETSIFRRYEDDKEF